MAQREVVIRGLLGWKNGAGQSLEFILSGWMLPEDATSMQEALAMEQARADIELMADKIVAELEAE